MNKSTAILELTSSSVKLVIGYELNGHLNIIYTLVKPLRQVIDNGRLIDIPLLQETLEGLYKITDVSARLNIKVGEVILILPPFGLDVFTAKRNTVVISEDSLVSEIDIRNLYNLIRKTSLPENTSLVDIIPNLFRVDNGETYVTPPMQVPTQSLFIDAMVHTLPTNIVKHYEGIVEQAGIQVRRYFVAPYVANELIKTHKGSPESYILVDIGSHTTTVTAIGGGQVISSRYFSWGGHNITSKIATSFNINEEEAEKLKITYGLDKRDTAFPVTICVTDDGNGNESKHYATELKDIIKNELNIFSNQLNTAINNLMIDVDPRDVRNIPLILTGGGSALNGLVNYIQPKVPNDLVSVFVPNVIGARQAYFTNCLGAILANKKHQAVFDEEHPKIASLSRDE